MSIKNITYNEIINILTKEEKNMIDKQILSVFFLKIEYIKNWKWELTENIFEKLLACFKIIKYDPYRFIILQNELPENFYILLKGSVNVYINNFNNNKINSKKNRFSKFDIKNKFKNPYLISLQYSLLKCLIKKIEKLKIWKKYNLNLLELHDLLRPKYFLNILLSQSVNLNNQKINNLFPGFSMVNVLNDNSIFGEKGLLEKNKRNASIISNTTCIMCYLEKITFQNLIIEVSNILYHKRKKFWSNFKIFNYWIKTEKLKLLYSNFKIKKFKYNNYIYKKGMDIDGIYLLKSGEVLLEIDNYLTKNNKLLNKLVRCYKYLKPSLFGNYENIDTEIKRKSSIKVTSNKCEVWFFPIEFLKKLYLNNTLIFNQINDFNNNLKNYLNKTKIFKNKINSLGDNNKSINKPINIDYFSRKYIKDSVKRGNKRSKSPFRLSQSYLLKKSQNQWDINLNKKFIYFYNISINDLNKKQNKVEVIDTNRKKIKKYKKPKNFNNYIDKIKKKQNISQIKILKIINNKF